MTKKNVVAFGAASPEFQKLARMQDYLQTPITWRHAIAESINGGEPCYSEGYLRTNTRQELLFMLAEATAYRAAMLCDLDAKVPPYFPVPEKLDSRYSARRSGPDGISSWHVFDPVKVLEDIEAAAAPSAKPVAGAQRAGQKAALA